MRETSFFLATVPWMIPIVDWEVESASRHGQCVNAVQWYGGVKRSALVPWWWGCGGAKLSPLYVN